MTTSCCRPTPTREGESFFPRTRVLYTVNGVLNPKVTMYPGEVQRWRLLNAAQGNFMSLTLKQHEFHVLAWDGLTLKQAEHTDVVMLSAGNRVELLVRAAKPGRYDLVLTPGSSRCPTSPACPRPGRASAARSTGRWPCPACRRPKASWTGGPS